ncbi:MAG: double-strand break repair helicase AddA [Rhodobacteraceae bacterium]|nr:double-strand break repair helicase AddA [Paracoccaceae bacterium]
MSKQIIQQASAAQILAARPDFSSWVSANAGSGKTRVLTNRVSRLLLRGTDPGKILCLTFTTAAASEMQNRLFKQLGEWAMLPDEKLQTALQGLGEPIPDSNALSTARTLFARALETPGGLKIQTIHAFCESLLHRFPLEAQISPDFEIIDDRQTAELRVDVLNDLAESHPDIFDAMVAAQFKDPAEYLPEILKYQERFDRDFDQSKMAKLLETEPGLSEQEVLGRILQGLSDLDLQALANAMAKTVKPDAKRVSAELRASEALQNYKNAPVSAALDMLEAAFLTSGKPRSTTKFPVNAVKDAFPPAFDLVTLLIERVAIARESRLALQTLSKSRALHEFARVFLRHYTKRKAAIAGLEFEDLIRKSDALLRNSEMAQWVLYRLDGGIDHILVDEAQDTSPLQWRIVSSLAEEIYATANPDQPRTVFVVGDEKQSIFSFQGADPHEFARMRTLFGQQLRSRGADLAQGELLHSFRSAAPILQLVDTVFQGKAAEGLSNEITHLTTDKTRPGRVEIWPFIAKPDVPEPKKWFEPVDAPAPGDPQVLLAETIAERIAGLIASGHELPGQNRAIRAGDFLILVQSRTSLFHATIKALKSKQVPVAGSDRLKVAEELAVKDLMSVLQFASTPNDNLALACALRSPLCGVSEAELFALAHDRKGTLWQALGSHEMLGDILGRADFERPYELLERILIHHKGRQKLLARLGPESEDGIDELLHQAQVFESKNNPSLTRFLEWISTDVLEIKRRMDASADQVRVMTVHGAKGLEAPIVILPQTVKKPNDSSAKVLPVDDLAMIGLGKKNAPRIAKNANEMQDRLQQEEKNRLLYVALTRAETWLMIAGAGDPKKADADWFGMVRDAALTLGATPDSTGRLVFENHWSAEKLPATNSKTTAKPLPEFLNTQAKAPVKPPKPRSPSNLGGAHSVAGTIEDENAILRGNQIHLLLEKLVGVPPEHRENTAQSLLGNAALNGVIAQALNVLNTPELAKIFAPETLQEVAITADIPGIGPIFGRIDALITGTEIIAIDFKSNAIIPETPAEIPEAFLRQMGAYRVALSQIWPDRPLKTAICWTNNASLMEIPENICMAALQRATTP